MIKAVPIIIGAGLLVLWLAGIGGPGETALAENPATISVLRWIAWLDLFAGLGALAVAVLETPTSPTARSARLARGLGISLMVLGVVGLVTRLMGWLTLGNFIFGVVLLLWSTVRTRHVLVVTEDGLKDTGVSPEKAA